jgi:hypothetical protein
MKKILLMMLITFLGLNYYSFAQGDLLITPSRVVFDGKQQKKELSIVNSGKDTATYSISFVQKNMKEDGSFENVDQKDAEQQNVGQMYADPYLRIFPRTVTLAPGEAQVIVLQCNRKKDMAAGEYRSHLYFRAEQNSKPLGMENTAIDPKLITFQITPVYGITIPIIIRSGKVNSNSTLSNLKLGTQKDNEQKLGFTINRSGNISTYGNIIVEFIPDKGEPYQVAEVNGVGVYANINKRNMDIKLDNTTGKKLTDGKLKVQYVSNDKKKQVVYAEELLVVK